jgi:hypothetical protein
MWCYFFLFFQNLSQSTQKNTKTCVIKKFTLPKFELAKILAHLATHLTALNTIPEKGRSFLAPSGPPPTRPRSTMNLSHREPVKLRERTSPRKPRPASVAGSTPTFSPNVKKTPESRSKSTDRLSRPRGMG